MSLLLDTPAYVGNCRRDGEHTKHTPRICEHTRTPEDSCF